MRLQAQDFTCPTCTKTVHLQTQIPIDNKFTNVYSCGHIEIKDKLILTEVNGNSSGAAVPSQDKHIPPEYYSLDKTKKAHEFQLEGINFIKNTNYNALLADAMGLGKTIQALLAIKSDPTKFPVLIVVKSAIIYQWAGEYATWVSNLPLRVMPILTRANIIPGFDAYLISRDLIGRKGIVELLIKLNIVTVVIDECHAFKDSSSARTKALITFLFNARIQYKIALSGTPIKNRADEYFTILNLLDPVNFRSLERFRRNWLSQNEKGQYTRVNQYRLDEFRKLTSKYILRREKHEVLKDLPPLTRDYQIIEIEDPDIKQSYNRAVSLFENFMLNEAKITSTEILGWLAKLRALTGQAKCQAAIDWAQEFLDSSEESLSIGIQHTAVRDTLYHIFNAAGYEPLKFSGEDSPWRKQTVLNKFNAGENRLLVINMIAGGEGINLQSCANTLILERQWNSADEEQFEGRFHRQGQKHAVTATYLIAKGTIDEFFHNMVERKRKILGETLSGWSLTGDENSLKELSNEIINNKLK